MSDNKTKTVASAGTGRIGKKPRRRFSRYEHFKCAKLGLKWRRPRGLHSKVRQGRKGKPPQVNIGYGQTRAERGLVNGYAPAYVYNVQDLNDCSKTVKAVIIGSGVGVQNLIAIAAEAEKLGLKILNDKRVKVARHRVYMIEKQRADRKKTVEVKTEVKPAEKPETKAEVKPAEKVAVKAEAKPVTKAPVSATAKKSE